MRRPTLRSQVPGPVLVRIGVALVKAVLAETMREAGVAVLGDVGFDLLPVALVGAHAMAPGADGQQAGTEVQPTQGARNLQTRV